ncbi:MAG: hypothetical protein NC311_15715 [Muribaculaceae bacterium]|nr:hypothetical protein [Muribaculaceae bacterium]
MRDVRRPVGLFLAYGLLAAYWLYLAFLAARSFYESVFIYGGQTLFGLECRPLFGVWACLHGLCVSVIGSGCLLALAAKGACALWCAATKSRPAEPAGIYMRGKHNYLAARLCGALGWAGTAGLTFALADITQALMHATFGDPNGAGPLLGVIAVPVVILCAVALCILSVFWSFAAPWAAARSYMAVRELLSGLVPDTDKITHDGRMW